MTAARIFETPWGRMGVAATVRGLARVVLPGKRNARALARLATLEGRQAPRTARAHARQAERQIREYLRGRRRAFTVRLDLAALPGFHKRALLAARKIPYGRTATYGEVAARAGRPCAARAVGQAMARNPVPLAVPCHRVVAAGDGLGGFGGGAALKRRLLALEFYNAISTQRSQRPQRRD
jgi:methylated-DNA-[protein]-cysteine S-methyltransferase